MPLGQSDTAIIAVTGVEVMLIEFKADDEAWDAEDQRGRHHLVAPEDLLPDAGYADEPSML